MWFRATGVLSPRTCRSSTRNQVAALVSAAFKYYDAFIFSSHYLERLVGGEDRSTEIWSEYTEARDSLLAKHGKLASERIVDLRQEFKRRNPAWVHLWD